jgi:hypothetical protein
MLRFVMADVDTNLQSKTSILSIVVGILGLLAAIAGFGKAYYESVKAKEEADRLKVQIPAVTSPAGHYQWEVASEGWWGYIDVNEQGIANIQMWKFANCPGGPQKLRLFDQIHDRTATLTLEQDNRVRVDFPVIQNRYDEKCNKIGADPKTLKGYLDPTRSYYSDNVGYVAENGEAPPGGMTLVKRH